MLFLKDSRDVAEVSGLKTLSLGLPTHVHRPLVASSKTLAGEEDVESGGLYALSENIK